jgi:hypothetical protein
MAKALMGISAKKAIYTMVIVACAAGGLVFAKTQKYFTDIDELSLFGTEVKRPGSTLYLYSDVERIKAGDTFTVNVQLDTQGESIDGVDIYSVKFDPTYLEVVDTDRSQAGVQVSPGGLMPVVTVNRVDNKAGMIQFAQVTSGGTRFKGKGKFMSINLKALKAGKTLMSFDYIPGNTADTNVSANGADRLKSAAGLDITIGN